MDNQQVLDLFINRGMIDHALAADIIAEIDHSGTFHLLGRSAQPTNG
jgi:hypothetical protein